MKSSVGWPRGEEEDTSFEAAYPKDKGRGKDGLREELKPPTAIYLFIYIYMLPLYMKDTRQKWSLDREEKVCHG